MVERSGRGKGKRKLLASHQRSFIWGRNLVRETLACNRWPILELLIADDLPTDLLRETQQRAETQRIPLRITGRDELDRLGHTSEHQGFLAKMGEFPYADWAAVWGAAPADPLFLVLDGIQDPFNFGAMLRSAGAFGVDAVVIGSQRQVPVTSMVARSSAGVVNRVPIVRVAELFGVIQELRSRQVLVVGTAGQGGQSLPGCRLERGVAIVIGNEGKGVSPEVLAECDRQVRIPLSTQVESLNAAAAAAVFLYEVQRQRAQRHG